MRSIWTSFSFSIILPIVSAASNNFRGPESHRRKESTNSTLRSFTSELQTNAYGTTFAVNVTLGGDQTFPLLVDTGSSDLWVVQADWICVNDTSNATLPQEDCGLGPETYHPASSFQQVQGEFYGEIMGNGRQSGILGKEDVTIGGATVKTQTIGVANVSSNPLDGTVSGIFGLAYPVWTSAHPGSVLNQSNDTYDYDRVIYSPFFNSLYEEGQCEPYFSLALERIPLGNASGPGGYLTFGGLPPVDHSANFSVAPVQITPLPINMTNNKAQPSWWTINVDNVMYGPGGGDQSHNLTTNSTQFLAVVDSGNWFNFLPNDLADLINSRFSPPAVLDPASYPPTYTVACNATAPTLGFSIGNQTFFHDGRDLILDAGDGSCVSTVISFAGVSYEGVELHGGILGASFLKNVVAVFDFGKTEMRFAARTNNTVGASGGNSSSSTTAPSTSSAPGHLLTWGMEGLMLLVAMVFASTIAGLV